MHLTSINLVATNEHEKYVPYPNRSKSSHRLRSRRVSNLSPFDSDRVTAVMWRGVPLLIIRQPATILSAVQRTTMITLTDTGGQHAPSTGLMTSWLQLIPKRGLWQHDILTLISAYMCTGQQSNSFQTCIHTKPPLITNKHPNMSGMTEDYHPRNRTPTTLTSH